MEAPAAGEPVNSNTDTSPDHEQCGAVGDSSEHSINNKHNDSNLSLEEELLLGDLSQSSESLADFTKSEEELLSSFAQTPPASNESGASISSSQSVDSTCTFSVGPRVPSFLEKAAFRQRVRNATFNLSSLVFSPRKRDYKVQWVPAGTAKVMHSVACSPMPSDSGSHYEKSSNDENQPVPSDEFVGVHKEALEANVDLAFDPSCEKSYNCEHLAENVSGMCLNCYEAERHETSEIMGRLLKESKEKSVLLDEMEEMISDIDSQGKFSTPLSSNVRKVKCIDCSPVGQTTCDVSIQNVVGLQSAMTSPMRVEGHHIAVQHEPDTCSVLCSPIRMETHDVSVQNEADNQSMACSPMKIPQNDVSVQHEPDQQTVMCSPFRVPVLDVSIQNVAENQSMSCSPMVPRSDQDKSVLACVTECTDQCVGTDPIICTEVGVAVQPDQQSVYTDMEGLPMVNTATSMTPIKFDKKNGKR